MANFSFTPSPAAQVASRVEKATSQLLISPDWAMNLEICDIVNIDYLQAKDVIRAIKKRLQNKNPSVQLLTLTLLETIVMNCGDYLHSQVVEREILQDMLKIVRKKADMQVRDKTLELLDSWQEAFGGPGGKYPQYYWAYVELKRSGVAFPRRSRDSAPVFTPPAHQAMSSRNSQVDHATSSNTPRILEPMASKTGYLSLSELKNIRVVMELLDDMLKAVKPNDRGAVKDDIISELVNQCRSNQKKLRQMLYSTWDEKLLGQGLELNDNLQALLAKHDSIASGTFRHESPPNQKMPESLPASNSHFEDEVEDKDEDDDGFEEIARRNSHFKSLADASTYPADSTTSDASSSVESKALVLLDPPPAKTSKADQDMIDLLSLALVETTISPDTPVAPASTSSQNGSPSFSSSVGQDNLQGPQPPQMNQGFTPYNSYVAPWAQPAANSWQVQSAFQSESSYQSQPSPYLSTYGPLPWNTGSATSNPFLSSTYQIPTYYAGPVNHSSMPGYTPSPLQQRHRSFTPQMFDNPTTTAQGNDSLRSLQSFSSSGLNKVSSKLGETQGNATLGPRKQYNSFGSTAGSNAPNSRKPYYHPDSLFGDLIDLTTPSTMKSSKSPMNSASTQSRIN